MFHKTRNFIGGLNNSLHYKMNVKITGKNKIVILNIMLQLENYIKNICLAINGPEEDISPA